MKERGIAYEQHKSFDDLLGKDLVHKLSFDFFLPAYNLLIEIQGSQHYACNDYFQANDGEFSAQVENDLKKYNYACQHGFHLLYITNTGNKAKSHIIGVLDSYLNADDASKAAIAFKQRNTEAGAFVKTILR